MNDQHPLYQNACSASHEAFVYTSASISFLAQLYFLHMQEDVARLRAQLRDSEAALATATAALSAVESQIQVAAGQQLAERQALQVQAAQLESQERDVEVHLAHASNQHQGVLSKLSSHAAQRQELAKQGVALKEAAEKLQTMADRIRARVNLDKEATVARQQLRAACDAAAEKLQQLLR